MSVPAPGWLEITYLYKDVTVSYINISHKPKLNASPTHLSLSWIPQTHTATKYHPTEGKSEKGWKETEVLTQGWLNCLPFAYIRDMLLCKGGALKRYQLPSKGISGLEAGAAET